MKRKKRFRWSAVICALCCLFTISAFAADGSADAIDELMQSAVTANEAESEAVSYELYQQFTDDPETFLSEFAVQPENVQQTAAQFVAWENAYDTKELPEYLADASDLSKEQQQAADMLLEYWTEHQSQSADETANSADATADKESSVPSVPKSDEEKENAAFGHRFALPVLLILALCLAAVVWKVAKRRRER